MRPPSRDPNPDPDPDPNLTLTQVNGYAAAEPCPRMLHVDVHGKMDD